MKLQLWRNATLQLKINDRSFLIDPMLGKKGSFGVFPWTNDDRENPMVELPFSDKEIESKLANIDAVFVSHLHPDHWDKTAVEIIDKSTPIISPKDFSETIASYGFTDVQELNYKMLINDISLFLTNGQHGTGEIGKKMGQVYGIVLQHQNRKVYISGDTIWCKEVKEVINIHRPQHIIIAGGAATFAIGNPVTMTAQHIKELAAHSLNATIWITHLEAVSPCKEDRVFLRQYLKTNNLQEQCKVLQDGEEVLLTF